MRRTRGFWRFYQRHHFLYRPTGVGLTTLGFSLLALLGGSGHLGGALSLGLFFHTLTLALVCSEIGVANRVWRLFASQRNGVHIQGVIMKKVRRATEFWPFSGPDILYQFEDEKGHIITAREERIRKIYTAPLNAGDKIEVVHQRGNPRQCCLVLRPAGS